MEPAESPSDINPPRGFPWGSDNPTKAQRLIAAAAIATIGAALIATEYRLNPGHHSDFGQAWFGARQLLSHHNPWRLIGPGLTFEWPWGLMYPATSLVLAMPLAWLSEALASTVFVWLSVFLLVWVATRDSWFRLPAFVSLPFVVGASAGQWSALIASSWFLPATAAIWIAKPTLGAALAVSAPRSRSFVIALGSAVLLSVVSLILMPSWPGEWLAALGKATHLKAPITAWGGFAIAANLLRWRRPEAWLLIGLACIPQTAAIYDLLLILVVVPSTYREACLLSLMCTVSLLAINLPGDATPQQFISWRWMLYVACCYLPATVLVLRRPNEGPGPAWLIKLTRHDTRA